MCSRLARTAFSRDSGNALAISADTLAIQSSGDEGIVLRLYVDSWSRSGDVEAAEKEALKRYRLNAGDNGDRVEVVQTLQVLGYDGSL